MTTAFLPFGKYQKRGKRLLAGVHVQDQVGQQALLLVGLRDGHLVQVDPVGLHVTRLVAVELVVRP